MSEQILGDLNSVFRHATVETAGQEGIARVVRAKGNFGVRCPSEEQVGREAHEFH